MNVRFAARTLATSLALVGGAWVGVSAQGGLGRIGGRSGFGRGANGIQRAPGVDIPQVVNAVNLLIEHRQELALSDTQFTRVIAIKRVLDSTNAPLFRKLDSVQRLFKNGPLFSQGSAGRRDSVDEARSMVKDVTGSIRENNADGRDKAYALLSAHQLETAHGLEAAAEQKVADEGLKGREGNRGARPPSG